MIEGSIYSEIIKSKTQDLIPVFKNGKTVDSRYDPKKDAARIIQTINSKSNFYIVLGIASGILINELLQSKPNSFIFAIEKCEQDIKFLTQIPLIKELSKNIHVCFTTIDSIVQNLINYYLPSFYDSFEIIEQRGWISENLNLLETIKNKINKSINIVSADFSVQSHFGKLWMHNIISNFKLLNYTSNIDFSDSINKKAIVVAAGPTIDESIKNLIHNKNDYFFIATDTGFSILLNYGIVPDVVISLDGQQVSNTHFISTQKQDLSKTQFLFDLTANNSACKKLLQANLNVNFFRSGHPLCSYINDLYNLNIPSLFTGSGTVTICCVDFALKFGFKNIDVIGADFSYLNGKPYAKGTYLDKIYNVKSNKLVSSEYQFMQLEYRTSLIKNSNNIFSTQILESYKHSFEDFLSQNNLIFSKNDNIYFISNNNTKKTIFFNKYNINDEILHNFVYEKIDFSNKNDIFNLSNEDICLLPLISWLKNHDNKKEDFVYYLKESYKYIQKYI